MPISVGPGHRLSSETGKWGESRFLAGGLPASPLDPMSMLTPRSHPASFQACALAYVLTLLLKACPASGEALCTFCGPSPGVCLTGQQSSECQLYWGDPGVVAACVSPCYSSVADYVCSEQLVDPYTHCLACAGYECGIETLCDWPGICDGFGGCVPVPSKCDDTNVCTLDSCNDSTGACAYQPASRGTACPAQGSLCTADVCDGHGTCGVGAPVENCATSEKALLRMRNAPGGDADRILWKWIDGGPSTPGGVDPSGGFNLCIYSGSENVVVASGTLPGGDGWIRRKDRYRYFGNSPDGFTSALLKQDGTSAKALLKGKGNQLPDPQLPLVYPVTLQFWNPDLSLCLQSTFTSADERKNTTADFHAKQ